MLITQALLHSLFHFDHDRGVLIWKPRPREHFQSMNSFRTWNGKNAGKIAGCVDAGKYRRIGVFGKNYKAHRLVWFYVYGQWPVGQIDHISGQYDDNRLENLRDVPNVINARNRGTRSDNTSGAPGISWAKRNKKWSAKITVDGSQKHIGLFRDFDQALVARKAAEARYGFHPNNGRS